MSIKANSPIGAMLIIGWIAGMVLAKGFWATLIAFAFPLWAWYLVMERLII